MEILFGIFVGILWILMVNFLRSLTTLFHELGHALPSLLFTNGPVNVYIGTYGSTKNTLHLPLGRLSIFFRFNFFNWNLGMCSHQRGTTLIQEIIIVLGGPIASLLIAIPLFITMIKHADSELTLYIIMAFVISAFIDFFVNIIPSNKALSSEGGRPIYNDGYTLLLLFSRFSYPSEYYDLEREWFDGNKNAFFKKGEEILEKGKAHKSIYDILIDASIEDEEWNDAIYLYKEKSKHYPLKQNDFLAIGRFHQKLHNHNVAIEFINKYLYFHYDDPVALSDRAASNIELRLYKDALRDLDMAIDSYPNIVTPYIYRGLAYTKMRKFDLARNDLFKALDLHENHPVLLQHLGIFHDAMNEHLKAQEFYNKAEELKKKPKF